MTTQLPRFREPPFEKESHEHFRYRSGRTSGAEFIVMGDKDIESECQECPNCGHHVCGCNDLERELAAHAGLKSYLITDDGDGDE